ncbi:MAG TPA: hypothetical protein VLX92_34290 [Kofleriaceae bacterium]|nr:hypothetical protein [Kofleriaceae bacterium]
MIDIQIKAGGDPKALAELIASTQGDEARDPALAHIASLVRTHQAEVERARPPWDQIQTLDFHRLDPENDWTDV